jgi:hypothetical protein
MRWISGIVIALGLWACKGDKDTEGGFDGELLGILVVPDEVVVPQGDTVQLTATGLLEGRQTIDLTSSVEWSTSDGSVAAVSEALDAEGELSAFAVGTVEIRAIYEDFESPVATAHVTDAELQRLSISPDQVSLVVGESVQLTANALFSDGSGGDVTNQVRWVTSDGAVGQLSDGELSAVGQGSAEIHVEWEGTSSDTIPISVQSGGSSGSADLHVSAASGSLAGGVLDLSVTIENQGSLSASSFWLDVFINPSSTPGMGDLGTDFVWVDYLAADGTETFDFQLEVDGSSASVYVLVDSGEAVDEESESNNGFSASVSESTGGSTSGPDLEITYFSYLSHHEALYYYVDITNSGDEAASWFFVDLYIDESSAPSTHQDGDDYVYVDELSAGETAYADFLVEEYCTYCWSWVQVDGYESVEESDEDNNIEGPLTVESE